MEQCNTHNRQLSSIKTAVALLHLLSFGVAPTESSACGRSFPVAPVWFDLHQVRGSFAPAAAAPATCCIWGPRRAPSPPAPPHSQASPLRAPPGRAICGAASGRAPSNAGGGGGRSWGLPMLPAFEKAGPPPTPARGRGEERRNDEDPLRWRVLRPLPRSRSGRRQPHPRGHCLRAEGASSGGGCRLALLPLVRASRPLSSAQCASNICTPLEVSAPLTAPDGRCGPVAGHTGRRRSDHHPCPENSVQRPSGPVKGHRRRCGRLAKIKIPRGGRSPPRGIYYLAL